ncbi:hypothetical protein QRX60_51145 [Amycolatopsis mongoliensis]|uniref:Uncharacterized protein n=1 Tax=Amycolatopsis mongoliensis TaxID=715475 RepID=A0A9Y2NHU9_9PSEU|nr:hypothetical protein [Amycolatopsis sp. 4-36]WIY02249.1 hypothetical protein QRX60_51145 [Amycolatopsis sp. 4-36]
MERDHLARIEDPVRGECHFTARWIFTPFEGGIETRERFPNSSLISVRHRPR